MCALHGSTQAFVHDTHQHGAALHVIAWHYSSVRAIRLAQGCTHALNQWPSDLPTSRRYPPTGTCAAAAQISEGATSDYYTDIRSSKFCLSPYGHGWGIRTNIYMAYGCVPVIIQDHVYQVRGKS